MGKIEHIFNELVEQNKKEYITSQEFDIDYIKSFLEGYEDVFKSNPTNLASDFAKKYYKALVPSSLDPIIAKYDDEKIEELLARLDDEIVMISGDFWGIQKFIFDGITTKKASKILRSRSAIIQLFTYVVSEIVKSEFAGSDTALFGAGKFLILASKDSGYKDKIQSIQTRLDRYFLDKYFGQSGFILSSVLTTKARIKDQESGEIKADLIALAKDNERRKLNKFDIVNLSSADLISDSFVAGEQACRYCGKRSIVHNDEESCGVCHNEILLGTFLTKFDYVEVSTDKGSDPIALFGNYFANFSKTPAKNSFDISSASYHGVPKWSLGSYVPRFDDGEIKTFSDLEEGSSGLMALKADIDRLGDTFRRFYMKSFKKFNRLSREVDFFFSDYATHLIESEFRNCYVVFAGGDDLFLIGEYKEIVRFAKRLRSDFVKFALKRATLSMGVVMFKSSTPINYISKMADEAEARAKAVKIDGKDRDGIDLFGISMKFDEFLDSQREFEEIANYLEIKKVDSSSFYYRLLAFCDMKRDLMLNVKNAMWKSKLKYTITRNIGIDDSFNLYEKLDRLIDNYGEKLKPSIFLKIYSNREKKEK